MKHLAIVLVTCIIGACAHNDLQVAPAGSEVSTILITVNSDPRERFTGSPSRIFSYGGRYSGLPHTRTVLRKLSKDYRLVPAEAWPIKSLGVYCQVFTVPKSAVDSTLAQLNQDQRVESAQLLNEFHTLSGGDPYRKLQHNLDELDVNAAHGIATGHNIRVAVIDTHIDGHHPDLQGRLYTQENVVPGRQLDADIHGTAVAGIIGARRGNGQGIEGIAPESRLIALTACWAVNGESGRCNSFTLARALDRAISTKAQIINLSLSGPKDVLLERIIKVALAQNIIVIGAHDDRKSHSFPCAIDGVLGVAATSNSATQLFAPGTEILTTVPNGRYDFLSGSSFSAAHVSGVAALALEVQPDLTVNKLRSALLGASDTNGKISACETLQALNQQLPCDAVTSPRSN